MTDTRATIHLIALCLDCRRRHPIEGTPSTWLARMSEWEVKHRGHRVEFRSPHRTLRQRLADRLFYPALDAFGSLPWWMRFSENADIKIAYAASADLTITLANLASSSTFVVGRESTAISNASNKYLDYLLSGFITTGTTPTTAKSVRVYLYGSVADTPDYPDAFTGSDAGVTVASTDILAQLPCLYVLGVDNTTDREYPLLPKAASLAFGGVLPQEFGVYVAHDTVAALKNNAANQKITGLPVYATAA